VPGADATVAAGNYEEERSAVARQRTADEIDDDHGHHGHRRSASRGSAAALTRSMSNARKARTLRRNHANDVEVALHVTGEPTDGWCAEVTQLLVDLAHGRCRLAEACDDEDQVADKL